MKINFRSNAMSFFQTSQTFPTGSGPGFVVNLPGFAVDSFD